MMIARVLIVDFVDFALEDYVCGVSKKRRRRN